MKLLLDTNAYSALMRGRSEIVDRVRKAERVLISCIVAGELMFGFRNGNRVDENLEKFDAFLNNRFVEWVPLTLTTADRFFANCNRPTQERSSTTHQRYLDSCSYHRNRCRSTVLRPVISRQSKDCHGSNSVSKITQANAFNFQREVPNIKSSIFEADVDNIDTRD